MAMMGRSTLLASPVVDCSEWFLNFVVALYERILDKIFSTDTLETVWKVVAELPTIAAWTCRLSVTWRSRLSAHSSPSSATKYSTYTRTRERVAYICVTIPNSKNQTRHRIAPVPWCINSLCCALSMMRFDGTIVLDCYILLLEFGANLNGIVIDDHHRHQNHFHGLSHCMVFVLVKSAHVLLVQPPICYNVNGRIKRDILLRSMMNCLITYIVRIKLFGECSAIKRL